MKEEIRWATITEKIGNDEYTVIISKTEWGYYWLLRMWTKIEGSYEDVKKYFTNFFNLFKRIEWIESTPETPVKKSHRWRPKGKPRGPRKPKVEIKKTDEVSSTWFMSRFIRKK